MSDTTRNVPGNTGPSGEPGVIGNIGSSSSGIAGTSGNGTASSSGCDVHKYSKPLTILEYSELPSALNIFSQILILILFWGTPFFLLPLLNLKSVDHDGNTIISSAMIFSIIITVCFLTPIFIILLSNKKTKKDTNVYKIDDEESFKKKMKQHEQFIKDQQSKYK